METLKTFQPSTLQDFFLQRAGDHHQRLEAFFVSTDNQAPESDVYKAASHAFEAGLAGAAKAKAVALMVAWLLVDRSKGLLALLLIVAAATIWGMLK